ncbi:tripartite tricarboxylate transporter substrate binding protein [Xylophilus sp. GW821-FHT01B05]
MKRRLLLATPACAWVSHGAARAQSAWPAKPIRIIVPFPAGGQTDVAARLIGQALGEALKTPVFVENKAGAHGFIGGAEAARAPADGYTLLVASTGAAVINPLLHKSIPYDPLRDFRPVSLLISVPIVVMVNTLAQSPQTLQALVAKAKEQPGRVNYASAGNGGSSHLVAEYFKYRTRTAMTHIPYRGEAPAAADVAAGQVDLMFNTLVSTLPHVRSGKVRMLATTGRERLPDYPDMPTVAEALRLMDFEASSWAALYAPAGTPADIAARLSAEVDAVLKGPGVAQRLRELGAVPMGGAPERLAALQRAELDKWRGVIQAAGIKPD